MKKVGLLFFPLLTSLILAGGAAAHVQLDYPVGGETFVAGEIVDIQWHIVISHPQENWDLYFSYDGGATWEVIQLDLLPSELNYQWTVPQAVTEQARIRIYMDNTGEDYENISGDFTIEEIPTSVHLQGEYPKTFALYSNYPNPFNPATTIEYALPKSSEVLLTIYNLLGHEMARLVDGELSAGYHSVAWDASNVTSGVYFYTLQAGEFVETRKMVLLR